MSSLPCASPRASELTPPPFSILSTLLPARSNSSQALLLNNQPFPASVLYYESCFPSKAAIVLSNSGSPPPEGASSLPVGRFPKWPFAYWFTVPGVPQSRDLLFNHLQGAKNCLVFHQRVGQVVLGLCKVETENCEGGVGREGVSNFFFDSV